MLILVDICHMITNLGGNGAYIKRSKLNHVETYVLWTQENESKAKHGMATKSVPNAIFQAELNPTVNTEHRTPSGHGS
jgi:hypothetical protein